MGLNLNETFSRDDDLQASLIKEINSDGKFLLKWLSKNQSSPDLDLNCKSATEEAIKSTGNTFFINSEGTIDRETILSSKEADFMNNTKKKEERIRIIETYNNFIDIENEKLLQPLESASSINNIVLKDEAEMINIDSKDIKVSEIVKLFGNDVFINGTPIIYPLKEDTKIYTKIDGKPQNEVFKKENNVIIMGKIYQTSEEGTLSESFLPDQNIPNIKKVEIVDLQDNDNYYQISEPLSYVQEVEYETKQKVETNEEIPDGGNLYDVSVENIKNVTSDINLTPFSTSINYTPDEEATESNVLGTLGLKRDGKNITNSNGKIIGKIFKPTDLINYFNSEDTTGNNKLRLFRALSFTSQVADKLPNGKYINIDLVSGENSPIKGYKADYESTPETNTLNTENIGKKIVRETGFQQFG